MIYRKRFFLFSVLFMHMACLCAQNAKLFTVSGYVYDASSRETLIGANIYETGRQLGAASNNYGFYSITLPHGEVILSVSHVGYATVELRLNLAADTVIDVLMEASITLQEVVVEVRRSALSGVNGTQLGAVSISPAMVRSVPAILGEVDLLKALQQMPGV